MPQDFVLLAAGPVQPMPCLQLMSLEVHCKTFQYSDAEIHDSFPLPTLRLQQPSEGTLTPVTPTRLSLLAGLPLLTVYG